MTLVTWGLVTGRADVVVVVEPVVVEPVVVEPAIVEPVVVESDVEVDSLIDVLSAVSVVVAA
ncbi:MAG: hypothetical protein OES24_00170 [Acidimicrobiia bacterium]|nr:hypothetical protein [Acidimicrobiia bacterium]